MDALVETLALQAWKPALAALLLPPVPFLLLMALAAFVFWRRRGIVWMLTLVSLTGLWFSQCEATAYGLSQWLLKAPQALSEEAIADLRRDVQAKKKLGIVVIGAGIEPYAPEYGVANLNPRSIERLRYGLWLSKRTGAPVGFTGGIPWGGKDDESNAAAMAARVAKEEFGRPLQWVEPYAKDTHESAIRSVGLLRDSGVQVIVLVTHGWHMPRAQRAFEAAAQGEIEIIAAPMGMSSRSTRAVLRWMPSAEGATQVRLILREWIGKISGA